MADDLYQETLIAHARSGRERKRLANPDGTATLDNPLCGDRVTIDVSLETSGSSAPEDRPTGQAVISAIGHEVRGCMLCEATAAMIAAYGPGMSTEAMAQRAAIVRTMIKNGTAPPPDWPDFQALAAVHGTKSRHNCVLLAFDVLASGLANAGVPLQDPADRENSAGNRSHGDLTDERGTSTKASVRSPPF